MKITKYASQSCVKCRLLDKILNHLGIKDYENIVLEEVGMEEIEKQGVQSFPTLILENNEKKQILTGNILPQNITDAINNLD